MLDLSHLINTRNGGDVQLFNALGPNDMQSWVRPRGKSHVTIIALNGGGGGGGGFSAAAATARGGGGGGGSGSITKLMGAPIEFLPETLFINVGLGGAGGAANSLGLTGGYSTVLVRPDTSLPIPNRVLIGGAAPAGGGGAGTASIVGAAGTAGTAVVILPLGLLGAFISNAGVAGTTGGAVAGGVGTALVWGNNVIGICGGTGGGGTTSADFSGGAITGGGWFPTIPGGVAGSNRGNDGYFSQTPFAGSGGSGGGSSNLSIGGNGGIGAIACGGGGGGGGTTGGSGGNGGPGLVIISCW